MDCTRHAVRPSDSHGGGTLGILPRVWYVDSDCLLASSINCDGTPGFPSAVLLTLANTVPLSSAVVFALIFPAVCPHYAQPSLLSLILTYPAYYSGYSCPAGTSKSLCASRNCIWFHSTTSAIPTNPASHLPARTVARRIPRSCATAGWTR